MGVSDCGLVCGCFGIGIFWIGDFSHREAYRGARLGGGEFLKHFLGLHGTVELMLKFLRVLGAVGKLESSDSFLITCFSEGSSFGGNLAATTSS